MLKILHSHSNFLTTTLLNKIISYSISATWQIIYQIPNQLWMYLFLCLLFTYYCEVFELLSCVSFTILKHKTKTIQHENILYTYINIAYRYLISTINPEIRRFHSFIASSVPHGRKAILRCESFLEHSE